MKIKEVLDRTAQIVLVDRQTEYNQVSKTEMHERIALAWTAVLNVPVSAHDVALCMTQLKVIRAACQPGHEDSYVDACGYMSIAAEIMDEQIVAQENETTFMPPQINTLVSGELHPAYTGPYVDDRR